MKWQQHIISDPEVLSGKPIIKGTRLSVGFILGLLGNGWTEQQILQNYPSLTTATLQALFSFVAECMQEEYLFPLYIGNNAKKSFIAKGPTS